MPAPIGAGIVYSLLVFLAAAMLGSIRQTILVPLFGADAAVMIEVPIILAISWNICGIVLQHLPVAAAPGPRLLMGAVALAFILLEELALATLAFAQSFAEFTANYSTVQGLIGLGGQILFGLIPAARLAIRPGGAD